MRGARPRRGERPHGAAPPAALGNLSTWPLRARSLQGATLGYLEQSLKLARRAGNRPNIWFATGESTYALSPPRPVGRGAGHVRRAPRGAASERPCADQPGGRPCCRSTCKTASGSGGPRVARERTPTWRTRSTCRSDGASRPAAAASRWPRAATTRRCDRAEQAVATEGIMGAWPQNVKQGTVAAVEATLVSAGGTGWRTSSGASRGSLRACARRSWRRMPTASARGHARPGADVGRSRSAPPAAPCARGARASRDPARARRVPAPKLAAQAIPARARREHARDLREPARQGLRSWTPWVHLCPRAAS